MSKTSGTEVPARTRQGEARHLGDVERDLFRFVAGDATGGRSYYERPDDRFIAAVRRLAVEDDGWLCRMIDWMASYDRLRPGAIVAATELVRTRLGAGLPTSGGNRQAINNVLDRPDEPGELLAYWIRRYGRSIPKPIKRGVADAARRLYDERAVADYDVAASALRFGDVIDLTHPVPGTEAQGRLFRHVIDRRHGRGFPTPETFPVLRAREELFGLPVADRGPRIRDAVERAGMSWELLTGWLTRPLDASEWEFVLPTMSYPDRLRALPVLDKAGVSPEAAGIDGTPDAGPLQIFTAYSRVPAWRWGCVLERALDASLADVPELTGRTLILIDRSASMFAQVTRHSGMTVADLATMFGVALALRARRADLVQFGAGHAIVSHRRGEPVITVTDRFTEMGDGTAATAVRARHDGHDRVIVVTDEPDGTAWQGESPLRALPPGVPAYIWNVVGAAHYAEPCVFAGLTDASFAAIPLIEAADSGRWPW